MIQKEIERYFVALFAKALKEIPKLKKKAKLIFFSCKLRPEANYRKRKQKGEKRRKKKKKEEKWI